MNVLDLFAGLGGWSAPFRERGHDVRTLDRDPAFGCDVTADLLTWDPSELGDWRPQVVTASPPCEAFSVLRIGRNWTGPDDVTPHQPKTDQARLAVALVERTRWVIDHLAPRFFVIENPRAKLRKLPAVADLERRTVNYCHLGEPFAKPSDLWGGFPPSLALPALCRCQGPLVEVDGLVWVTGPDGPCHLSAPRGSTTSIQGDTSMFDMARVAKSKFRMHPDDLIRATRAADPQVSTWDKQTLAAIRAKVPYELGLAVCLAAEADLLTGANADRYQPTLF